MKNMSPSLQAWSDFFSELDHEAQVQRDRALRAKFLSDTQSKLLANAWMRDWEGRFSGVAQSSANALLGSGVDRHASLQVCLTQALCILEEVKHVPAVTSVDSQFGDFHTLLGLLEEANSHLQTLMAE